MVVGDVDGHCDGDCVGEAVGDCVGVEVVGTVVGDLVGNLAMVGEDDGNHVVLSVQLTRVTSARYRELSQPQ